MAIYHASVKVISRSHGRSATGAAAYRAGVAIADERTGLTHDYTRKPGVESAQILAPRDAPTWVQDRARLWNAVEGAEKRKDAQVAREVEVALPQELGIETSKALVLGYVREQFVARGMVADVTFHDLASDNPHAHILLTTRRMGPEGFGKKVREWNRKELLQEWRRTWERHANRALEQAGVEARIDHRSLEAQGVERAAQIHLGPRVARLEERGIRTDRGDEALRIEQRNARIRELIQYREVIEHERHRAIEASAKRGGAGRAGRAVGASLGGARGRDTPDPSRAATGEPSAGRDVEPAAAEGGRGTEAGGIEHRARSTELAGTGGGHDAGHLRADVAAVGGGGADWERRSGSYERVLALASPAQDRAGPDGRGRAPETSAGRGRETRPEAEISPPDRTYLAVRRQLQAMGCDGYEVGLRDRDGRMLTRTWSHDEVLRAVPWLKRQNARGADIYVRPAGEQSQGLVLVDDLDQSQITRMKREGLAPAAVIETSPLNFQAWVRLTEGPLAPAVATTASRGIAQHYGGDLNSADWRHFGRLAGFTNRKLEHTTAGGHHSWVLCHEASGQQADIGSEAARAAQQRVLERMAEAERQRRLEALQAAPGGVSGHDPVREYQRQLQRLSARYGAAMDVSKADFMICKDMALKGYSAQDLTQALHEASPELPRRKLGHEQDYVERTVRAAFEAPEVRQHLEVQRTRSRDSPGLSR
jgi:MobA/MobL family/RepB DNA-primase from phage plasmid